MSDLLGDFHRRDVALQKTTNIEITDGLDVCLCYDHFKNQNEKRINISLEFDFCDKKINKEEAKKLIEALQKLINDL